MPNRERRKGLVGEREVRDIWRHHGFNVQDLQHNVAGHADQLVTRGELILLCDPKRQEQAKPWRWIADMEANALVFADTLGAPLANAWVIPFRRSRSPWYAIIGLEDLARLLA